jgi:hypothetical protein
MARIVDVHARRVWDSRGRATVEAEVILKGARGRAIGRLRRKPVCLQSIETARPPAGSPFFPRTSST